MDLAEIWRVMRRRWYVLLPGLVLTAALTTGVYLLVPVEYMSQSTVSLLNSKKATVAFDGNPFLSTQASLTGMADGLARNLNSDGAAADLKSLGVTGKHEAKIADNAQGPFMWLTVTGRDPDAVLRSDELLTAYAEKRLEEFQTQQSVAPDAMIRMTAIVPPQKPEAQTKTLIQYLVMVGALGFVLSLVATFFVEARKRPRVPGKHRPAPGEGPGEGPGEDPDEGPGGSDAPPVPSAVTVPSTPDAGDPTATLQMAVARPNGIRPVGTHPTGNPATGTPPSAGRSAADRPNANRPHGSRPGGTSPGGSP